MFSLVESMVALGLTMVLMGSVVPLVSMNARGSAVAPELLDEQQRARLGADAIAWDLMAAGRGLSVSPHAGPLIASFPPVLPRRLGLTGADPFNVARADAITIIAASASQAQSVLLQPVTGPNDVLTLDATVGCPAGTQVCGLQQGSTALLFDGAGAFDLIGILGLQGPTATFQLHQAGNPGLAYAAGAAIAEAEQHTYYFDAVNRQLRHADGAHTDVPVVDNVASVAFEYFSEGLTSLPLTAFTDGPWLGSGGNQFDSDLLRVRLVRVTLRVQAGNPVLRGAHAVPDYTLRFDVAPRNMNPGK
ncbi:MAG TPA: hypothetical protein VN700_20150 [Vicinamibacterales bacterium]|nr:hypothetical protein [Vicinamibacterales bacterium]